MCASGGVFSLYERVVLLCFVHVDAGKTHSYNETSVFIRSFAINCVVTYNDINTSCQFDTHAWSTGVHVFDTYTWSTGVHVLGTHTRKMIYCYLINSLFVV